MSHLQEEGGLKWLVWPLEVLAWQSECSSSKWLVWLLQCIGSQKEGKWYCWSPRVDLKEWDSSLVECRRPVSQISGFPGRHSLRSEIVQFPSPESGLRRRAQWEEYSPRSEVSSVWFDRRVVRMQGYWWQHFGCLRNGHFSLQHSRLECKQAHCSLFQWDSMSQQCGCFRGWDRRWWVLLQATQLRDNWKCN